MADSFPAARGLSGEEGGAVAPPPPAGSRFKGGRPTCQARVGRTRPRYELDLQEAEPVILHRQFRRDSTGGGSAPQGPVALTSVTASDGVSDQPHSNSRGHPGS